MRIFMTVLAIVLMAACAAPAEVQLDTRARLEASANNGDLESQYQMGRELCCGDGPGHSSYKAFEWFCRAASKGHPGAQYELGRYYGARMDTHARQSQRQEIIYAYAWYSLAALQSFPLSADERDALANDMTTTEIREANEHVRDWLNIGCPAL